MDATAEQEQWTKELIEQLEKGPDYGSEQLMNRIEQMISSRDLLEQYITVLNKKVRGNLSASETMQDRLLNLLMLLQRLDEREKQSEDN
jgi:hypothetical protein